MSKDQRINKLIPKKRKRQSKKVKVPILNSENFSEWYNAMINNLKAYRLSYYVENDIKLKEMKSDKKEWYKKACKKVYNLLLSSTDKEDNDLIKEKTNENIASGWFAILQKYEDNKTERTIRLFEKLLQLKLKPTESNETFLKNLLNYVKTVIKNIDSIDDFAFILLMSKLNTEYPGRYKQIEDYLKDNIERITIDDIEKKIFEFEKSDDKKKVEELFRNKEKAISNESVGGRKSVISKKGSEMSESRQSSIDLSKIFNDPNIKQLLKFKSKDIKLSSAIKSDAKVNDNKSDISSYKSDIKLPSAIGSNKSDVSSYKSDINTNKSEIGANKSDIASYKPDVSSYKSDIATNKSDIDSYKPDFSSFKLDIGTNKLDIGTNKSDISSYKSDISTNKSDTAINNSNFQLMNIKSDNKLNINKDTKSDYIPLDDTISDDKFVNVKSVKNSLTLLIGKNLNDKKSLELIKTLKLPRTESVPKLVAESSENLKTVKSTNSLNLTSCETTKIESKNTHNEPPSTKIVQKKTPINDSSYDSKSLRLSSSENSESVKTSNLSSNLELSIKDNRDLKDQEKTDFTSISKYLANKSNFDINNQNLNLGIKEKEFSKLDLGNGITPPSSLSQSLNSGSSQSAADQNVNNNKLKDVNIIKKEINLKDITPSLKDSINSKDTINLPDLSSLTPSTVETFHIFKEIVNKDNFKINKKLDQLDIKEQFNLKIKMEIEKNFKESTNRSAIQESIPSKDEKNNKTQFKFEGLPMNALKKILLYLKDIELITFIKTELKFYDLVNDCLKEIIVVNKNYNSQRPFFQNLFYTNEYVDHRIILRDSTIFNLKRLGFIDINKQIRKLITNELSIERIEFFKGLEYLEINLESDDRIHYQSQIKTTLISNQIYLNFKLINLKILSISTFNLKKNLNLKVDSSVLSTLRLINFVNLKLTHPEHVVNLYLDSYDKIADKFHHLIYFNCKDFREFRSGLLNKKSSIKKIQLVNAHHNNLINLFRLKKKFKLKLSIYVQGIKVDGIHQKIIVRDVTTFYGEMRIYLKYVKRLNNLDFLTELDINFDIKLLDNDFYTRLFNLIELKIDYKIDDKIKWKKLLRSSKILQRLTINQQIQQSYLDLMPEYVPNCLSLKLYFDNEFDFLFIKRFTFLNIVQMNHQLSPLHIYTILQFRHQYLYSIVFNYERSLFKINLNRDSNQVKLVYKNKSLILNLNDFERQLNSNNNWIGILNRM